MSKKNGFRHRFDFSKIPATIQIPNLIEVQKRSYERFLQMDRLPSEREWEYAARAGANDPPRSSLGDYAWFAGNSDDESHPVGLKKPNAWGLYDMYGNVAELVIGQYDDELYAD